MEPGTPFGGKPPDAVTMGQLTTRTSDIDACTKFWTEVMGMQLLTFEKIEKYGFNLYFFGYPEESDLAELSKMGGSLDKLMAQTSTGSSQILREWLYQRKFTTLEVQVPISQRKRARTYNVIDPAAGGFHSVTVEVTKEQFASIQGKVQVSEAEDGVKFVTDPDNMLVKLVIVG